MKKYVIGFLSVFLLIASIMGAQSKRPKGARSGRDSGSAMWI
jgi:hypothetical protein